MNKYSTLRDSFFSKNGFLFDLDGTLYLGKKIIPGAVELIQELQKRNKKILYFTNNSSRSVSDYLEKLTSFGFQPKPHEILMSTHILMHYLEKKKWHKVFLLGTPSMQTMLEQTDIRNDSTCPDAVVIGFDKTLTYDKLLKACRLIEQGCPWIVTHPDVYCPSDEGIEPDCGAIAALIVAATSKKPIAVLGKPHPLMVTEALRRLQLKKKEIVIIGDRLLTDMAMANNSGIDGLLVLSGETKKKDLSLPQKKKLFGVVTSVRDLLV